MYSVEVRVKGQTKCKKCGMVIKRGEKYIKRTNGGRQRRGRKQHYHQECYTDAHGKPIMEEREEE